MDALQKLIHRLEVGGGLRHVRSVSAVLLLLALTATYNWRAYKNMSTQEAMDSAQVARNVAQGKGFTTLFIRPFSLYLVKRQHDEEHPVPALGAPSDPAQLKGMHPDLANPPLYPMVLATLMKILPFRYPVDTTHQFWSVPKVRITEQSGRDFWRYQPDFLIAAFNELLFFAGIILVFFLARRLFDRSVAWLSALLMLGTELLWRFSVAGLSTMVLLLIFLALVWCVVLLDEETREPKFGGAGVFMLAGFAGLLTGMGALTRYAFGWVLIPLLVYLVIFTGRQRVVLGFTAFLAFAAALAPWVVRNYSVSGTPFGTATYALLEATPQFPEHHLARSLAPDLHNPLSLATAAVRQKLTTNTRQILETDLPKLGGTWVSAFFMVGLLITFRNPTVKRLRYFLIGTLVVLALAQALGRTHLSEDSPVINSENLLVLLTPLVLIYGVSFFFLLLEQIQFPFRQLRYGAIGLFGVVACLPLIFTFLSPKQRPLAFPPYNPPDIQNNIGWVKDDELIMSDVPWAVAWYGQSQCVWLTTSTYPDFFTLNDYMKPVQELFLTMVTLDERFLTQWMLGDDRGWGALVLQGAGAFNQGTTWPRPMRLMVSKPEGEAVPFPLSWGQPGWPSQFVCTFRAHWPKDEAKDEAAKGDAK